ncbi:MAG: hypothetical protein Q9182_006846 [Xanthomendoza sp. 2 TL-2023]
MAPPRTSLTTEAGPVKGWVLGHSYISHPILRAEPIQSHLYSQQNLTNPNVTPPEYRTPLAVESVTDGYVTHDSTWPSTNEEFITSSSTNRSSPSNVAGLRLYGSVDTPSQTQQFQPVGRKLQSAPLAPPPDFHPAHWTKPSYALPGHNLGYPAWDSKGHHPTEAPVPAAFDYGQGSQASHLWLPHQAASPCQMFSQHSSSFLPDATNGIDYSHGNITPTAKTIERWPQ